MKYAHFYNERGGKRVLYITSYPTITIGNTISTHEVKGKVEARRIAKELGAKCWNF